MPPSESSSTPITRRRLAALTAAGGSALVLTACGTDADPNIDSSDSELAQQLAAAQMTVSDAYGKGVAIVGVPFKKQSDALLQELTKAGGGAGPTSASAGATDPEAAENSLIATANTVVPDFDSDALRDLAYRVSASAAGRLAALSSGSKKEPAPTAFVLGTPDASS